MTRNRHIKPILFFSIFISLLSTVGVFINNTNASAANPPGCSYTLSSDRKTVKRTCVAKNDNSASSIVPKSRTFKNTDPSVYKISYFVFTAGSSKQCTETITLTGSTKGTHKTSGGTCPLSEGSVSIVHGAVNGEDTFVSSLSPLINKSCGNIKSQYEKTQCENSWKKAINDCATQSGISDTKSKEFANKVGGCVAQKKGVDKSKVVAALKKGQATIVKQDKVAACEKKNKEYDEATDKCVDPGDKSQCNIDGIGWIICPVFYFMGKLNDQAFKYLDDILKVEPELLTDTSTKQAWDNFRNIGNVLFVIAFLIIIYSQMTGFGVSNYGIKRLLPKLIIAAILVNVSFYLCQIAADVSNIAGSSIRALFDTFTPDVSKSGGGPTTWDSIMGSVLVVGIGIALLAAVILAPAVLLAFAFILLILVARKALIILLIVVSPLAFVAYLLPNTEQWAKKWWKLFSTLLLLFPIVAAVFGVSELASNILLAAAAKSGGEQDQQNLLAIVGLAVAAVPLFAVPALLKGALASTGAIGARVAGMQDKANKRASKRIGERTGEYRTRAKNRVKAGGLNFARSNYNSSSRGRRAAAWIAGTGSGVTREQKNKYAQVGAEAAERNYVADRAGTDEGYARKIAGSDGLTGLVQAYSIQAQDEELEKDVKASQTLLRNKAKGMTADAYREHLEGAIQSGSVHDRVAAMNEYGSVASDEKVENLANNMAQLGAQAHDTTDPKVRDDAVKLQRAFASSFGDRMPINVGATDKANMQSGNFTTAEASRIANAVSGGKISAGHVGRMKFDEMKAWNKQMSENGDLLHQVSPDRIQAMHEAISAAEKDPRINMNFGDREVGELEQMKQLLTQQWTTAQTAKGQQDAAAGTYGSNI